MTDILEKIVIDHLFPAENYIWGFANLTGLLQNKFKGFDFGISIGQKLDSLIVDKVVNGPTPEYYLH
jgi:hypothetical protein